MQSHVCCKANSLFSTHFSFVGLSSHNNSAQAQKKKGTGTFFNWNNSKLKVLFFFHFTKNNKSQCVSQSKTSTFLQLPQRIILWPVPQTLKQLHCDSFKNHVCPVLINIKYNKFSFHFQQHQSIILHWPS